MSFFSNVFGKTDEVVNRIAGNQKEMEKQVKALVKRNKKDNKKDNK